MNSSTKTTKEILAELTGLYQTNPARFEELRKMLIKQTIERLPAESRQRAYGLQFVIESKLSKYKDPVVRMNKMVEIFWEQLGLFQEVLQNPYRAAVKKEMNKKKAMIIPFRKKKEDLLQNMQ